MTTKGRIPLWITNTGVFGLLIAVVLVYFFWQATRAKQAFLYHVNEHAQLVAGVTQLNVRNAFFSQEVTEEILQSFLSNSARFVDYLDGIEPFAVEELTAFAAETNLAGIRIYKSEVNYVEGPPQCFQGLPIACSAKPKLEYREADHLYVFSWPRQEEAGCILIGLGATNIELMQRQLSLENFAATLSKLPGICYANIEQLSAGQASAALPPEVVMLDTNEDRAAEFRLCVGNAEIVVGICTDYLVLTLNRIWRDFFVFGAAIALLGAVLSFVLYRQQSYHFAQVRRYERQLSRQREDAALGRAAASIAHEVRNPLNAIKMGLQRLQLEGHNIAGEPRRLLDLMLNEVRRTNAIVSGLLSYARPQDPKLKPIRLDLMVNDILELYIPRCQKHAIGVTRSIDLHEPIMGDHDLLHQVVENLVKNAIEAQPDGGFIDIQLGSSGKEVFLSIHNGGFALPENEAERILEPYFTSKAEGTGLGLSIAQRVIQAHNGRIEVKSNSPGTVAVTCYLPIHKGISGT